MANNQNRNNQNQNQGQGERGGRGNFKNDPQRASEAGRKGGERSRSGSRRTSE